jgi:hypothetical protein
MKLIKKKGKAFAYILDELERDYPGPITNNLLLKDYNKYLRDALESPDEPCNFVIKTKLLEGKQYKLIPSSCWKILQNRFEGMEIKRIKDKDSYLRKYNVKFPKVSVID